MKRRDLLAAAGVGLGVTVAGCLGDGDGDDGDYPTMGDVELSTEAADIVGTAGITRQFSSEQPAGVWTQLTNGGSSAIEFEFTAFASPYFYRLNHEEESDTSLTITDEVHSPNDRPNEPTEDCWRSGFPPREPATATRTLDVEESLTTLYFIAAPTTAETCVPAGTYTSTYDLDVADLVHPIGLELTVTFED